MVVTREEFGICCDHESESGDSPGRHTDRQFSSLFSEMLTLSRADEGDTPETHSSLLIRLQQIDYGVVSSSHLSADG